MPNLEKFTKYAAAFEQARDSDDWSVLAPFFDEDACYTTQWRPDLCFEAESSVTFDRDVIVNLRIFSMRTRAIIAAYLRELGEALGIDLA